LEGGLDGRGLRIALVVSRFNEPITVRLLEGARQALRDHGVADDDVTVAWVPGSFEIPLAAKRLAESHQFDAVVSLGAVIKGETAHFEHVAEQAAQGIAAVAREAGVPVTFGVLTTYTWEQAEARAGGEQGNKGADAALAAIRMADLLRRLGAH
jgi:6,7-dimethyl-8-ribityllumazine synthase